MKKNMGLIDRAIRILIAVAVTILFITNVIQGTLGIILVVISGVLVLTSLIGSCPLYMPLRITTKNNK
jgi:hypothetical protein